MQYDAKDPQAYLAMLPEDWRREKLLLVREMILRLAPELEEAIRYKMLNFGMKDQDDFIFALNAQKHYVSLYVGSIEKIANSAALLAGYDYGKGCIRIKKTNNINETGLAAFIQAAIDQWRQGHDVSC